MIKKSHINTNQVYYLNDVYYYLRGWQPPKDCMTFISGTGFNSMPGAYDLPCSQGSF